MPLTRVNGMLHDVFCYGRWLMKLLRICVRACVYVHFRRGGHDIASRARQLGRSPLFNTVLHTLRPAYLRNKISS